MASTSPKGTITIDASRSSSMSFEAFVRGEFLTGISGTSLPVFDNGTGFAGEEMFFSYGPGASARYVLMQGDMQYSFATHTVAGTGNVIEYGVKGSGNYDSDGHFTGGDVALRITGLSLFNGLPKTPAEEASIEANGPIHNFTFAHMYGAPQANNKKAYDVYAGTLDDYAQIYLGSDGRDVYTGTRYADTVAGNGGTDRLHGGAGDDEVAGGAGSDQIIGGKGTDLLNGGTGADRFIFLNGDTSADRAKADTIEDFGRGDIIDLSRLDADKTETGNQDFTFIRAGDFSGVAGELRYERTEMATWIEGDVTGDGFADFTIHIDAGIKIRDEFLDL